MAIVDDGPYEITTLAGTDRILDIGISNLTSSVLTASAEALDDRACSLTPTPGTIAGGRRAKLKLTVGLDCAIPKDGIRFAMTASTPTGQVSTTPLTAVPVPPSDDDPPWGILRTFPALLLGLFAVAVLWLAIWDSRAPVGQNRAFRTPLAQLDKAWSFKDNWVSNVTVGAGLLTGVLGSSEVVKAVLGRDAERAMAVATVGSAVALAFIGAGPIVLLSTQTKGGKSISAGGLLLAAAVTLTGALGQIAVIAVSGSRLDLGGMERYVAIPAAAATVLLLLYAYRTLRDVLDQGVAVPPTPELSDTIKAATMIVAALTAAARDSVDETVVRQQIAAFDIDLSTLTTSPGDSVRRTALL
ncbi:MAG: hypothetical protein ACR2MO_11840 [Acidimicrobiales bacterium]